MWWQNVLGKFISKSTDMEQVKEEKKEVEVKPIKMSNVITGDLKKRPTKKAVKKQELPPPFKEVVKKPFVKKLGKKPAVKKLGKKPVDAIKVDKEKQKTKIVKTARVVQGRPDVPRKIQVKQN